MENYPTSTHPVKNHELFSEEFIHATLVNYLKQNGYKVQKDNRQKETEKAERFIIASKFFKKEIIEVKSYPVIHSNQNPVAPKAAAKSWFAEALFNSFVNFSRFKDAEIAMALPNVGRYKTIISNLNDYFTVNNLYFRLYLVNEDGLVEVSNLNQKYLHLAS
jgi:hypothetical protein